MKQAFTDVVGNLALRQRLLDDIMQKRLSHAYILEGKAGTGKHTLALRIAASLACLSASNDSLPLPCMQCAACRKILSGNSPDLFYINKEDKATLGVDVIRALKSNLYIAPNELDVKIYIIEEAHLMTEEAQNAFLLTLEEPPSYVLFLLLCETTATLLETVKSRAPTLRTEPLDISQIQGYLFQKSSDAANLQKNAPQELDELLVASDGSIGKALELMREETRKPLLAKRKAAREFVRLATERRNSVAVLRYLNTLGKKRDELISSMQMIQLCLRDLLLLKQTEEAPLCFFANREEALSLAYSFTSPELLKLCDLISEVCTRLQKSANVRLTLTAFAADAGLLQ